MTPHKSLVIGASSNPEQYSHMAINRLVEKGHPVEAIGRTAFGVADIQVQTDKIPFQGIHTVTLYLNKERQEEYQEYILSLKPSRIIFNPGAENEPFKLAAEKVGIEAIYACTLVMLSTGAY
jgi:predicted CoA-binding protein